MAKASECRAGFIGGLVVFVVVGIGIPALTWGAGEAANPSTGSVLSADQRDRVQTILRFQQAYFEQIRTIEFRSSTTWEPSKEERSAQQRRYAGAAATLGTEALAVGDSEEDKLEYAADPRRFFLQTTYTDYAAGSRDGIYAVAWDGRQFATLKGTPPRTMATADYLPDVPSTGNPLFDQYSFIFNLGVDQSWRSLGGLQGWAPWAKLLPLAVKCKDEVRAGRSGTLVTFARPDGLTAEVFFASDEAYHPWYWRQSGIPGKLEVEYQVKTATSPTTAEDMFVVPLVAEWIFKDGCRTVDRIDGNSLKVNTVLDDSVFTIPDSIEYYHVDQATHALIEPAVDLAKVPTFARRIVDGVYGGSLRLALDRWIEPSTQAEYDKAVGVVAAILQRRFGSVRALKLVSNRSQPTTIDAVWAVEAARGAFEMKVRLNTLSQVEGIRFDLEGEGKWVSLPDLGKGSGDAGPQSAGDQSASVR